MYQQESTAQIRKKTYNLFAGKRFVLRLSSIPQGSGAHQPEANIVVPVVRVVVVPIGRTRVLTIVVPRPAAFHTVVTRNRSPFLHTTFLR